MSSIDKLLIRGIRSFDPQSANVIEFYSPLTIIVGHNGSGKTTIIECLKYATTGDLPPNSKQGAFIHDPKVAHETEVKAQVKLKFRNVSGKVMVCTRSLQLTQKAKQVQQKTLEAVLETKDPRSGERVSLSTRCADLDLEMPIHLGVSKAILDNVIFCHQEESNWPLAEPSVLKRKFDGIFESTRYTKALDNLRTLKKEMDVELKTEQAWLKGKEDRKIRAEHLTRQKVSTEKKIAEQSGRIQQLSEEVDTVAEDISKLMTHVAYGENLNNKLASAVESKQLLSSYMDDLKRNMVEILPDQTDEELVAALEDYKRRVAQQQRDQERIMRQKEQRSTDLDNVKEKLGSKLIDKGRYASELAQLESLHGELSALADECSVALNILPHERPPLDQFGDMLAARVGNAQSIYERLRRECSAAQESMSQTCSAAQSEVATLRAQRTSCESSTLANNRKLSELTGLINDLSREEAEIAAITETINEVRTQLQEKETELAKAQSDNKARELKTKLDELELRTRKLNEELGTISKNTESRARLAAREADYEQKQKDVDSARCKVDKIAREHGIQIPRNDNASGPSAGGYSSGSMNENSDSPEQISAFVRSQLQSKKVQLKESNSEASNVSKEFSSLETRLNMQIAERAKLDQLIDQKTRDLIAYTGEDMDYDSKISQLDTRIEQLNKEIKTQKAMNHAIQGLQQWTEVNSCCALCRRDVDNEALDAVYASVRETIGRIPERVAKLESELKPLEEQHTYLQRARPISIELQQLQRSQRAMPDARVLEDEKKALQERLDDALSSVTVAETDVRNLEQLQMALADWTRLDKELGALERECGMLRSEMAYAPTRSVEDVQRQLQELHHEREETSGQLEHEHTRLRELQQAVASKQSMLTHRQRALSEKHAAVARRDRYRETCAEIEQENAQLADKIKRLDTELSGANEQAQRVQGELASLKADHLRKQDIEAKQLQAMKARSERFAMVAGQVARVAAKRPAEAIARMEEEIESVRNEISDVEAAIANLDSQVQTIQRSLSEVTHHERNIGDNLSFRSKQGEFRQMETTIEQLQEDLRTYEGHSYTAQLHGLKERQDSLVKESSRLQGERAQLEVNLRSYHEDLDGEYANAHREFQDTQIKVKTTEMAISDLEKYAKALDVAIMKYHTLKMEEINKIIRELWVNTYQGSDIDAIEIRSDKESTRGHRQFSYRLVMLKGDTELEMRGRCSAGQKVLASLVIRLALAETFCLHCGILALDEPTTNLDRDNIEALAESLANIIKLRRQQSNFQLVIITHDEDFMQLLGKSEFSDYYWRVFKDENQHSAIERHAIREN